MSAIRLLLLLAIGLLLIAQTGPMSSAYLIPVHVTVTAVSALSILFYIERSHHLFWLHLGLIVLFNPLHPPYSELIQPWLDALAIVVLYATLRFTRFQKPL